MLTATTAAANTTSPGTSILRTLGAGSNIDTTQLVANLSAAQRAPADESIARRTANNAAQVSALAQVRSGLDAFVSALGGLKAGGDLAPQPASGDSSIVGIARDPSVPASPLGASVTVTALAAAQTVVLPRVASATAPIGQGTLTLDFGALASSAGVATGFSADAARKPLTLTIGPGNDSLAGLRDAINSANAGISASILNDGVGARLVLAGTTGVANGFTISTTDAAANPDSASLGALAFAPGQGSATLSTTARNAQLSVDGVAIERTTNRVTDALPGYVLTLNSAQPTTTVTLQAARDPGLLKAAVSNYVAAYNALQNVIATDAASGNGTANAGPLYGQSAIRSLQNGLAQLTSRAGGGPTLADLGVKTARDGTLSVDESTLTAAVAGDTGQIERLFAGTPTTDGSTPTDTGIDGAIKTMRDALTASDGGFTTYSARLAKDQSTIATDTIALDTTITNYSATLARQFATMNAAVANYKSIGSFLAQQIDAWNHTSSNGSSVTV